MEATSVTIRADRAHSLPAMALLALAAALGLSACGGKSASAPWTGGAAAFNWTHEAVRVQGAHDRVRDRHARTCCRVTG